MIIASQFAATSLWFAGNAVLGELQLAWALPDSALGALNAAVQLGFVAGTLCFAIASVSDRWSPPSVFFVCALLAAAANAAIIVIAEGLWSLLALRFITGFFLAGIYPVGMKIAASWYADGLGRAIGYLVGALVVGTAFPHLLQGVNADLPWAGVLAVVSVLAAAGGLAIRLLVPAGPHLPGRAPFDIHAIPRVFRSPGLRAAAFGYFGHMWELYSMWVFTPILIAAWAARAGVADLNVSLWSFAVLGAGALGCIGGGLVSRRTGSAPVALVQLAMSGAACLLSPLFLAAPAPVFFACMLVWGITVSGDSPQFSTLTANTAPREYVGTALTIVNSIGFLITAVSIQVLTWLAAVVPLDWLMLALLPGPVLGLLAGRRLLPGQGGTGSIKP